MSDLDYMRGAKAVWLELLAQCLKNLDAEERSQHQWLLEREATVAQLRMICEKHGDNDWPDSLHLADVIDKHLAKYLFG